MLEIQLHDIDTGLYIGDVDWPEEFCHIDCVYMGMQVTRVQAAATGSDLDIWIRFV